MNMVEVGKSYKCKNGCTFHCIEDRTKFNPSDKYQYSGYIAKPDGTVDRIAFYMINGRYNSAPSEYDLVFK
ncbi:hypothetical protein [Proteus mirabilis]|uniref:hypothetical protein n=2 Tax=Proteus TaxID=583 RepID=UPI0034E5AFDE